MQCNAKKQIQNKASLLTFAKKEIMTRSFSSSPHQKNNIMMLSHDYTIRLEMPYELLLLFTTTMSIFIRVFFLRIKTVICFVPVMALILRIFFLFT